MHLSLAEYSAALSSSAIRGESLGPVTTFAVKVDAQRARHEPGKMNGSAPFPLPAIGTRIYITMNNIGWATVEGFFAEGGYLGVMTKAENPPEWLRQQRQRAATRYTPETPEWLKRGIGCEFGAEIALEQPTAAPRPIKTA
jgi:hypothetical protein